jgi:hypothetical protein
MEQRSLKDILSGLIFIGIGLAFGIAASGYEIGTALSMGPGYFPLVLASFLVLLGLIIAVKGMFAPEDMGAIGGASWRALLLVLPAIVFFGATVRGLGLVPTLFLTVFITALAARSASLVTAAILAAGMTIFCVLIFSYGLGVPVPLLGPWVR